MILVHCSVLSAAKAPVDCQSTAAAVTVGASAGLSFARLVWRCGAGCCQPWRTGCGR